MTEKHSYAIAVALGFGIGFFLLSGQNTYGAGIWGNAYFGPFYSAGNSLGTKI